MLQVEGDFCGFISWVVGISRMVDASRYLGEGNGCATCWDVDCMLGFDIWVADV
jgi:hypothetical protein